MVQSAAATLFRQLPTPGAVLELFKPVTWFPPIWAFACGMVSAGVDLSGRWGAVMAGLVLAGPLLCAASQAVNDWFDRDVDPINEPSRPIPSGRIPGRWGLWIAIAWSALSLACAWALGVWVFVAALLGMMLAWCYSAPPVRLKQSGWLGPAACALSYEGVAWFAGAALALGGAPSDEVIAIALLYSVGAFGIMTLNDFKSAEGDRRMGLASLPVALGADRAAKLACAVMAAPQLIVVALLAWWGAPWSAAIVAALILMQLAAMSRLLSNPVRLTPWFNATGVLLFVSGMMASAIALAAL
jgi:chlorophyll synthase